MSLDQWALAVHVLSAFAYVGGIVLFWALVVAVRRVDTPDGTLRMAPIVKVGNAAVGIGATGTIVVGIYLAFALDSYAIWDGWIIAALVLPARPRRDDPRRRPPHRRKLARLRAR